MWAAAMAVLRPHRALAVASFVATLGLALAGTDEPDDPLEEPAPLWAGEPEVVPGLDELDCVECHADVAGEWKSTLHALSWVDETYRDDLAGKRRPEGCWGCHAPRPLAPTWPRRPKVRDEDRHLGVTCETCHRAPDGGILGPWGHPTDAHVSTRSDAFVGAGTVRLCTSCHATTIGPVIGVAKDFDARERTCVECHMAPVERELADGTRRLGRSHALQTPRDPAFLARAFAIELDRLELDRSAAAVRVTNRAGHRVPGLVDRAFEFTVDVFQDERRTARSRHVVDRDAWLPAGATVAIPLELDGDETRVRVRGEHDDPRLGRTVEFIVRELELR